MSYGIDAIGVGDEDRSAKLWEAAQQASLTNAQAAQASQNVQASGVKTEEAQAVTSAAPKTDTIQISEAGRRALAQAQAAALTNQADANPSEQADDSGSVPAANSSREGDDTEIVPAAKSSTSEAKLASLTEDQLKDLVQKGSITRSQMDTELARRGVGNPAPTGKELVSNLMTGDND